MNSETRAVLTKARALIEDPAHWLQGQGAVNLQGKVVNPSDPEALAFCAVGAVHRARAILGVREFAAIRVLQHHLPSGYRGQTELMSFNDKATHAAVLALFDAAIAGG